jgi:prepilin-type N-terminal cleavage/methylation domain-containing protein
MKKQDGFTLLELIVVLAILGIILSIAVPNYLGINENANNNAQGVQAALIAKSLQQEFADDFASVNESETKLYVEIDGSDEVVVGGKIDEDAPIRSHLCFTYVEDGAVTYPYFSFVINTVDDTITIKYMKSASDELPNLATVNYY